MSDWEFAGLEGFSVEERSWNVMRSMVLQDEVSVVSEPTGRDAQFLGHRCHALEFSLLRWVSKSTSRSGKALFAFLFFRSSSPEETGKQINFDEIQITGLSFGKYLRLVNVLKG